VLVRPSELFISCGTGAVVNKNGEELPENAFSGGQVAFENVHSAH
jgi:hypothetical protein